MFKLFDFLQVGNYGIGGMYWMHEDTNHKRDLPSSKSNPKDSGELVASILIVLNAAKAGIVHCDCDSRLLSII